MSEPSALERATIRAMQATDSNGLRIILCPDFLNPVEVKRALMQLAGWFHPDNEFIAGDKGEENALTNLILLAELLREHVRQRM